MNIDIVVLDGFTLNPGDLDWAPLERLGRLTVHDRTAPAEVRERAGNAAALLTNKTRLDAAAIADLPQLRYVGVLATGYDVVDAAAAGRRNIPVANVPDYCSQAVAQAVFAHLLNLTHHVADHAAAVREGRWSRSPDFSFHDFPLAELEGMTLGIVGLGRIGLAVAGIARAFGMEVVACTRTRPTTLPEGVRLADPYEVFSTSDAVTLHCPLTDETRGFVSAGRLALMKPTAFLINTARGQLVDEGALAEALERGRLAGAGLDVLQREPPAAGGPLLTARNCFVTPHLAWATTAARRRLLAAAAANLEAFLAGSPVNVVNDPGSAPGV